MSLFRRDPVKRFLKAQRALMLHAVEEGNRAEAAGQSVEPDPRAELTFDGVVFDWDAMEMGRSELESFAHATADYYESHNVQFKGPIAGPQFAKSISEQFDLYLTAMKACRERGSSPIEVEQVRWANMGVDVESLTHTMFAYAHWVANRSMINDPFDLVTTVGLEAFMHGVLLGREVPV